MGESPIESKASTLLVDESFAHQDDSFVDRLRLVTSYKYLAALSERWKHDPRPWAREQVFRYLAEPLDRPGHHPVVKRLFKHAEANTDDELMGAFLVAFDRLIRRSRRTRYRWDFQSRQSWQEEEIYSPRDQILPPRPSRQGVNPFTGEKVSFPASNRVPKNGHLFTYATRAYLRRRAWRYFRWMGFARPIDYRRTISKVLAMYRDDDFARGENILDNWSLMNIAFRYSDVLTFTPARASLVDGKSLGQLSAAPRFESLWKEPESVAHLLDLVTSANSRLVRVWAIQLLKRHHLTAIHSISSEQLLRLFDHEDEEVQQFGSELLNALPGLDTWPIETWLRLLETHNIAIVSAICESMSKRVRSDRLSLEQCVSLACARMTPVAKLGLSWLRERTITSEHDRSILVGLANARCEAVGTDVAAYALAILGAPANYRTDTVVKFFDSLNPQVREGAWTWLTPQSPGYPDVALWSRLLETPYDNVRLQLVQELSKRATGTSSLPALRRQDLAPLWSSVLLGVHRGGRAKLHALRQISRAIAEQPDQAERLMPALAVAIRSVRPPEARVGLSAILSAVASRPELEPVLLAAIPELRLLSAEGAA